MKTVEELQDDNLQLRTEIVTLKANAATASGNAWLEALKMVLSFLTPFVTAGAVYLSYLNTNAKLEAQSKDRQRIEEKIDEQGKTANAVASQVEVASMRADQAAEHAKTAAADTKTVLSSLRTKMGEAEIPEPQ
jgi:outer membrane murein-binding lipoprotein Lpp